MTPTPEEHAQRDRCHCGHTKDDHLMRYIDHANYIYSDLPSEACRLCYWAKVKEWDHSGKSQREISEMSYCQRYTEMDNLEYLMWNEGRTK